MGYIASTRSSIREPRRAGQENSGFLSSKVMFSADRATASDIMAHNKG